MTLADFIRAYRDDARRTDPHGREHQTADLMLLEVRDGRTEMPLKWAMARGYKPEA